jgi:tetratricopeptide (TPR) repeat protein
LISDLRYESNKEFSYEQLRQIQNKEWAQETYVIRETKRFTTHTTNSFYSILSLSPSQMFSVAVGIKYAKLGNYKEAMKKYTAALNVDPTNVDALVARGAASLFSLSLSVAYSLFKGVSHI